MTSVSYNRHPIAAKNSQKDFKGTSLESVLQRTASKYAMEIYNFKCQLWPVQS